MVPICPVCGVELVPHLRADSYFIENEDWVVASQKYTDFFNRFADKKIVFFELGVGFNTPKIIRWSFEQMVINLKESKLIRLNLDNVECNYDIPDKSFLIKCDIASFLKM